MSLFKIKKKTEIESLKGPYFLVSGSLSVPPNWSGVPDFGPDPDFFGQSGPDLIRILHKSLDFS